MVGCTHYRARRERQAGVGMYSTESGGMRKVKGMAGCVRLERAGCVCARGVWMEDYGSVENLRSLPCKLAGCHGEETEEENG